MPRLVPVRPAKLIKFFQRMGWTVSKRGSGDHIALRKEGYSRPIIIPDYNEVPKSIIKSNLSTAGITMDEYFEVMSQL
ncbi:MAG: type II toxin-antitoxin system HicA family toxin [Elusimicrobia bacterium]|nr:type II toxin-antitoxin system HicA family toxin [Elusimicrobiota bacterium]